MKNNAQVESPTPNFSRIIVAWTLVLMLLFLIGKTKAGAVALYYALALMIVILLVGQAPAIEAAIKPINVERKT